ncbi:hypothetical protein PGO_120200 [Plasmodium gonderi]|uniref:Variable surface protein n=1 Tax=Plasmodium gonderi TaxID=77519 RepID=A0A1Y1JK35_PLAGO|nr:hypothetical protein PGO_120200 [Plasmodium gonderi]GAW82028.1 hypothetical protein PGO_120200 [Plasmodium gonderi]
MKINVSQLKSIINASPMEDSVVESSIQDINPYVRLTYSTLRNKYTDDVMRERCCNAINFYLNLLIEAVNLSKIFVEKKSAKIETFIEEYWNGKINIDNYTCERKKDIYKSIVNCLLQKLQGDDYNQYKSQINIDDEARKIIWHKIIQAEKNCMKIII